MYREQNNYFHNDLHACDVVHNILYFINHSKFSEFMKPIEFLASLIAAAGHCISSKGLPNTYLINTRDEAAILYNDKSVQEMQN
jgi:cAMP-specific phosphodiesterase 4